MRLYARKTALTAYQTGLEIPIGYPESPRDQMVERNIPWSAANRERIIEEWLERYSEKLR